MNKITSYVVALAFISVPGCLFAQSPDSVLKDAGLQECIQYALKHQPSVQQYKLDEQITESNIKSRLADWYPQVNAAYNLQHNLKLPTSFLPDASGEKRPVTLGVKNTSNIQFTLSQNIFNRDVLLATRTAADVRMQSGQLSASNKIDIVVAVSKAYYDLLLTQKQVQVLDENILRLERSLRDAFNQYEGGIVDKIDYKRAQISLNNTRADRKRALEAVTAKTVYLKELMGYPTEGPLSVSYDSLQMEREVFADTTSPVQPANRIEYQLLQTSQQLLQANLRYQKWSFLPSVSAVGSYSPTFQNEKFSELYSNAYPTAFVGLQLSVPLFQGGKRKYNIRTAELQLQRLEWDMTSLTNNINTQYAQALASYKGSLAELNALKENLALAEDVYNTLQLQYNAGIKTYLEVIIAETDLRTAQLNYLNALYQSLAGKLDLQRATGTITF